LEKRGEILMAAARCSSPVLLFYGCWKAAAQIPPDKSRVDANPSTLGSATAEYFRLAFSLFARDFSRRQPEHVVLFRLARQQALALQMQKVNK